MRLRSAFIALSVVGAICLAVRPACSQTVHVKYITPEGVISDSRGAVKGQAAAVKPHADDDQNPSVTVNGWTVDVIGDGTFTNTIAMRTFPGPITWDQLPPVNFKFQYTGFDFPPILTGLTTQDYEENDATQPPPPGGFSAITIEVDVVMSANGYHANPKCFLNVTVNSSSGGTLPVYCAPGPDTSLGGCSACSGGKPLDFATGNVYVHQIDFAFPGLGGGLRLERHWNSLYGEANVTSTGGMFGDGWSTDCEERMEASANIPGTVYYHRADGSVWTFSYVSSGSLTLSRPASEVATLTSGSSYWTLKLKSGETRYFDFSTGGLRLIEDRNKNATSITRDSVGRITKVTDAASHSLYFNYGNMQALNLVSSVTSDAGLSTSYQYDKNGCLTGMTKTDGSSIIFENARGCLITSVKDSKGIVLESHQYDTAQPRRGTTSTRAGGVESLTVTYPQ